MDKSYHHIMKYIDDLHESVSMLTDYVEARLKAKSYISFPKARNRINWHQSNDLYRPIEWRLNYVSRLFIRDFPKPEKLEKALLFHVNLDWYCSFPFPSLLCARLHFKPSTEDEIFTEVWTTEEICTLVEKEGCWESFEKKNGWCLAKPSYDSPIISIKGYFLNAFDIDEPRKVDENIIIPLTEEEGKWGLSDLLTVKSYDFPGIGD